MFDFLRQGYFGEVYQVRRHGDGEVLAAKLVDKQKTSETQFRNEVDALRRCSNHPNIVQFIAAFRVKPESGQEKDHKDWCIIMQHCESSLNLLLSARTHLNMDETRFFAFHILIAVEYMHDNSVVHRDLMPDNILLDAYFRPKICDFGMAELIDRRDRLVDGFADSEKLDILSVGHIIIQLLTGKPELPGT